MNQLNLHDIQPLVTVESYSLHLFSTLIIIVLLGMGYSVYKILQHTIWNKQKQLQRNTIKQFKQLDITHLNSKQVAYRLSSLLKTIETTKEQTPLKHNLLNELEQYKYIKQSNTLNQQTLSSYHRLKKLL